jgi:hypothetical protein
MESQRQRRYVREAVEEQPPLNARDDALRRRQALINSGWSERDVRGEDVCIICLACLYVLLMSCFYVLLLCLAYMSCLYVLLICLAYMSCLYVLLICLHVLLIRCGGLGRRAAEGQPA